VVKRRLQKLDAEALMAEHTHICGASAVGDMTKESRMQLILDKLEANGTFNDREAEWKRQARTGRNQSNDVFKTTLARTTLGSSAAMMVFSKPRCGDRCENIDKERRRGTSRY